MSTITNLARKKPAIVAFLCPAICIAAMTGCGNESAPVAAIELSPPSPGQISGDPISPPYLSDLGGRPAKTVVMRFGDGTVLVRNPTSGQVEIVPAPTPDAKTGDAKQRAGAAETERAPRTKAESIPVPDPDPQPGAVAASAVGDTAKQQNTDGPEDYRNWQTPDVALFVTGRQHGYIEPCGCTGLDRQKGGMARRYTLMRQLRESGWTLIPVDGGDQVRRFGQQAEIKLQQTAKALQEMNYQAVGFGPDDLRLGVGELLSVAAAESPEEALFVSANVVLIDPGVNAGNQSGRAKWNAHWSDQHS